MKKKLVWLIVSCLMVAALVLASCAPAVVEEKKATVVTKEPEKKVEEVEEVVEKVGPQYGGTVVHYVPWEVTSFDPADDLWQGTAVMSYTHNALIEGNWWIDRDICDFKFFYDYRIRQDAWGGMVAESWEQPDPLTIIFHIRPGIYWQNKPPVNGRELVAEDVELHVERLLASPAYAGHGLQGIKEVTCPGKYMVKFTLKSAVYTMLEEIAQVKITAREVWEAYGNLREWRAVIGTGAFMLEDFVMGSSMHFVKNPAYWEKDPDGNQLPYVDATRMLIIPEPATAMAALRTGKIDIAAEPGAIPWQQKPVIAAVAPELLWERHSEASAYSLHLKCTQPPFDDVRVRQALTMAIDFQAWVDGIIEPGAAEPLSYPARPSWAGVYVPYEELPPAVKKVRTYDPEAAKALLAEAGLPNGFDCTINYHPSRSWAGDAMLMVAKWWEDIGVTTQLVPLDEGTAAAYRVAPHPYTDIYACGHGHKAPDSELKYRFACGASWNRMCWCDPTGFVDETLAKVMPETDYAKRTEMYREVFLYITEQCPSITVPPGISYVAWWPWVKGYSGESTINYHQGGLYKYVWLDLELRKEMVGR